MEVSWIVATKGEIKGKRKQQWQKKQKKNEKVSQHNREEDYQE